MGYSYYICAQTPELRDKMLSFLNQELPCVESLHPSLGISVKNYWDSADNISYVRSKDKATALGYDYRVSSDASSYFMKEVLKWAAHKVGKTISEKPYLVYDGEENESAEYILDLGEYYDECGKNGMEKYYSEKKELFEAFNDISLKELQVITADTLYRLEEAWQKFNKF